MGNYGTRRDTAGSRKRLFDAKRLGWVDVQAGCSLAASGGASWGCGLRARMVGASCWTASPL